MDYLDSFIKELLHLDDVRGNRLLDVGDVVGGISNGKAYRLYAPHGENSRTMLQVIKSRRGKPSNKTVLNGSALVKSTVDNPLVEKWEWSDLSGDKDPVALDKFISDVYNALDLKGNNPLFLGVGNLTWDVAAGDEIKTINSPLLIFPIRFVRGTNTSPVEIEFVDDDAFFNPCLINRMRNELSEDIVVNFPHPNGIGADFDDVIDLDKLRDGTEYMALVGSYVNALRPDGSDVTLAFDKDVITIAQYSHSDICMYYDVRRNKPKIYAHPLVRRVFGDGGELPPVDADGVDIRPVLPTDSVQEDIISRIAAGQSLIIKGPPGTGKTLTIANMLATLLSRGKRVIVASKKISALAEVYAKMPESLRKFIMLLDYETERQAAAVNPAEIRAEFKRLIKTKREYVYDKTNDIKYRRADSARGRAVVKLADYCAEMFGEDVAFRSYYDALDAYFKDDELDEIPFADCDDVVGLSRDDYNKLVLCVKQAAEHYKTMTAGGDIHACPWFGVNSKVDTEKAFAELGDISADMANINGKIAGAVDALPSLDWDRITYGDLCDAARPISLGSVDIKKLLLALTESDGERIEVLLDKYSAARDTGGEIFDLSEAGDDPCFVDINNCEAVAALTASEVRKIAQNKSVFLGASGNERTEKMAVSFMKTVLEIIDLHAERNDLQPDVVFVLDKAEIGDAAVIRAADALIPYKDGQRRSIGIFDLKARSAEKKLRALCSRSDITLAELAIAADKFKRIAECDKRIAELCSVLARVSGKDRLSEDEFDCILLVGDVSKRLGQEMTELVKACAVADDIIGKCRNRIKAQGDFTVQNLIDAVNLIVVKNELVGTVKAFCERAGVDLTGNIAAQARSLAALLRIFYSPHFAGNADGVLAFVEQMQAVGEGVASLTSDVVRKLKAFGEAHFANRYTRLPWLTTVGDTKVFVAQSRDRSVLNAAESYDNIVFGKNALPLVNFFEPIEDGKVKVSPERFVDLFLHSFYSLAIEHKLKTLGSKRNGLCKNAELELKSFEDAENELRECNAATIENLCMARINPDDDDFDFLAIDKGINMSLRMLFRQHAYAILKLKKCFIMSPSTASVLFRGEAYENFDVVIVDEASQIEPVEMLPVLFRSKQCVLVGDEFQMPPLTHFKAKNRKRISDTDSELTLDTDISALSLALGNLAFDAAELVCHYRSKTETLIEFSQRQFYPYMRTFPATVPMTPDLGFTDILTENGYCEDGVNPVEAQTAVEQLKAHFDSYYNEKTKKLSMSVGVVAFGEAQMRCIKRLVADDRELRRKIDDAYAHFDDVPDKLVFFRTIESVQGQETDHLILSVTYGKDRNGKVKLAFGDLNRDATGKNIFNVAVTRAKCRITVIHSITPEQMTGNPRVAFIQDYLAVARRYSEAGRSQFKSNNPEKGGSFIRMVADYIESLGIARERIVIGYGVTDGSVRIPIAILGKSLDKAEFGIWCEYPVMKKYDFYDYNVRYVTSLTNRGWAFHKVYAHDWLDNAEVERAALKNAIIKHVTI
ncbi:MAG: DUF4011 domain-containing protein [Clostridiales bacterium]|nr:DUF4011 domain-containing protein [Clostridiales bacterium]